MLTAKINRRAMLGGLTIALVGAAPARAKAPEIYMDKGGVFGSGWDYAVGGNDVVAYFDLAEGDAPVAGLDRYTTDYKGVSWRFVSQENLDKFLADPDRYRPQFGGYCAWAMARNKLARGAPDVWYVYGGKLYLNVSPRYKREWLAHIDRDISRGEANWPGILDRN